MVQQALKCSFCSLGCCTSHAVVVQISTIYILNKSECSCLGGVEVGFAGTPLLAVTA